MISCFREESSFLSQLLCLEPVFIVQMQLVQNGTISATLHGSWLFPCCNLKCYTASERVHAASGVWLHMMPELDADLARGRHLRAELLSLYYVAADR